jgi:hypothetical protein
MYQSIVSTGVSRPAYTAPEFGAYGLVFMPSQGFLASTQGDTTTYPHRALMFNVGTLFADVSKLFASQNFPASMDFVWIRLSTDADYVPTSMAGTPFGFRLTRVATSDVIASEQSSKVSFYAGTNPDTNPYASPHNLSTAVTDAIQQVAAAILTTVPVYYTQSNGDYAVLYNVSYVAIALNP